VENGRRDGDEDGWTGRAKAGSSRRCSCPEVVVAAASLTKTLRSATAGLKRHREALMVADGLTSCGNARRELELVRSSLEEQFGERDGTILLLPLSSGNFSQ
jgi:hypothetical protein